MVDLSNYPYPTYEPNKAAAGALAVLIGISLIAWIVQSIQVRFKPRRPIILMLISHVTIIIHLILRAALSTERRNSRAGFTVITVLLAVGLRTIILANYDFLTQIDKLKTWISRTILIGSMVAVIASAVLMAPAGSLSYDSDTIDRSFALRQASTGIILGLTILFYPIWFAIKIIKYMTKQAIILLIISSIACLIVSIFLVVTSVPQYYVDSNDREFWFYVFQLTPIAIAQFTWTILHPKRTLKLTDPSKDRANIQSNINDDL